MSTLTRSPRWQRQYAEFCEVVWVSLGLYLFMAWVFMSLSVVLRFL